MPTGGGGGGVTAGSNVQMNSLGVGVAADGTAGDALVNGVLATGGNATTGRTAGDVLVARAGAGLGVIGLGGIAASPNTQLVSGTDAGSNNTLTLSAGGTAMFLVGNVYVRMLRALTFASLPAPSASYLGALAVVTDSTVNTFGSTVAGTGANTVMAWCNGVHWTVTGI